MLDMDIPPLTIYRTPVLPPRCNAVAGTEAAACDLGPEGLGQLPWMGALGALRPPLGGIGEFGGAPQRGTHPVAQLLIQGLKGPVPGHRRVQNHRAAILILLTGIAWGPELPSRLVPVSTVNADSRAY